METTEQEFKTPEEPRAFLDSAPGGRVDEQRMRQAARMLADERERNFQAKTRKRKEREAETRRERLKHLEAGSRAFAKLSPQDRQLINAMAAEVKETFRGASSMKIGSIPFGALDALDHVLAVERARLKSCERGLEPRPEGLSDEQYRYWVGTGELPGKEDLTS